jgi:hypothetical protein
MNDKLQDYMDRPKRYENIDGTGEMLFGLMLLSFALAAYLEDKLPGDSSRWMHGLVIYSCLIPALGLGYWARRAIKEHLTWPRTGYAAYPRGGKSRWIARVATCLAAAVFALGVAFLMGFARRHDVMSLPRIVTLFVIVMTYAIWVFRLSKEHWWKWLLLLFMALGGLAIALLVPGGLNEMGRSALFFLGLVWLGSGAGTLYAYIRHTKPATSGTE